MAGTTLPDTQFGVAQLSTFADWGVLGLGFGKPMIRYNNIIDQLQHHNKTKSRVFSLYLGDNDVPDGIMKPRCLFRPVKAGLAETTGTDIRVL